VHNWPKIAEEGDDVVPFISLRLVAAG